MEEEYACEQSDSSSSSSMIKTDHHESDKDHTSGDLLVPSSPRTEPLDGFESVRRADEESSDTEITFNQSDSMPENVGHDSKELCDPEHVNPHETDEAGSPTAVAGPGQVSDDQEKKDDLKGR